MARQVNHLSDIPSQKKYGSKYGGRTYKRYSWNWGRGAKQGLKRDAEQMKREGRIRNYRLESYEDVLVNEGHDGRVRDVKKTVHVLYVRR